jgi:hypothetical protein
VNQERNGVGVLSEVGGASGRHGGGFVSGLVPWIVYWILVGNVDFRLAVLIALGVAAFELLQTVLHGEKPKVLDVGSTAAFAVLTIVTYATDDTFLERWIQPITSGALLAIALGSILIGKPFARQYAREQVPEQLWDSPGFLHTTLLITWVWVGVFAVMTVSALIPPIVDGQNTFYEQDDTVGVIFYWVVPFVALAAGIVFTKWYPKRARARALAS